jgi:pantothenate kinase type III
MNRMLMAIDVGNINTVSGLYRKEELLHCWRLVTARERAADSRMSEISSRPTAEACPLPLKKHDIVSIAGGNRRTHRA